MTDNGTYYCDAENKFDSDSASAFLIVRGMHYAVICAIIFFALNFN